MSLFLDIATSSLSFRRQVRLPSYFILSSSSFLTQESQTHYGQSLHKSLIIGHFVGPELRGCHVVLAIYSVEITILCLLQKRGKTL